MTSSPIWYSKRSDDHVVRPRTGREELVVVDNEPWLDNDGHVQWIVDLVVDDTDPWLDNAGHVQWIVDLVVDDTGAWLDNVGHDHWIDVVLNVEVVVLLVLVVIVDLHVYHHWNEEKENRLTL